MPLLRIKEKCAQGGMDGQSAKPQFDICIQGVFGEWHHQSGNQKKPSRNRGGVIGSLYALE